MLHTVFRQKKYSNKVTCTPKKFYTRLGINTLAEDHEKCFVQSIHIPNMFKHLWFFSTSEVACCSCLFLLRNCVGNAIITLLFFWIYIYALLILLIHKFQITVNNKLAASKSKLTFLNSSKRFKPVLEWGIKVQRKFLDVLCWQQLSAYGCSALIVFLEIFLTNLLLSSHPYSSVINSYTIFLFCG